MNPEEWTTLTLKVAPNYEKKLTDDLPRHRHTEEIQDQVARRLETTDETKLFYADREYVEKNYFGKELVLQRKGMHMEEFADIAETLLDHDHVLYATLGHFTATNSNGTAVNKGRIYVTDDQPDSWEDWDFYKDEARNKFADSLVEEIIADYGIVPYRGFWESPFSK